MAQGKSGLIHNAATVSAAFTGDYVLTSSKVGRRALHVHVENTNLVGTLKLMGSNDPDGAYSALEWVLVDSEGITSGNNNDVIFDIGGSGVKAYRVDVAFTSGAGTITVLDHQLGG